MIITIMSISLSIYIYTYTFISPHIVSFGSFFFYHFGCKAWIVSTIVFWDKFTKKITDWWTFRSQYRTISSPWKQKKWSESRKERKGKKTRERNHGIKTILCPQLKSDPGRGKSYNCRAQVLPAFYRSKFSVNENSLWTEKKKKNWKEYKLHLRKFDVWLEGLVTHLS